MAHRETRTVSFTPELAHFISSCVESGRFQSASEVVRAGLRLLQHDEELRQAEVERIRAMIQVGADQLDRGDVVDGDEFFRAWEEEHRRLEDLTAA